MLSSDKNVENFAQLIEVVKHYLGLQAEYVKLDVIDKVVHLITGAALAIVFCFLIIALALFMSFAFAFWLSNFIGMGWSFLIITIFHLIMFFVIISKRKDWIEKPLVRFLADVFLSK
jgi:hypothetical protein